MPAEQDLVVVEQKVVSERERVSEHVVAGGGDRGQSTAYLCLPDDDAVQSDELRIPLQHR